MATELNCIAIIPARSGSKRIPGKNIREFLGKPIIAYSIETALQSGLFNEVMVSTDSEDIAKIARKYGAKVPFYRSIHSSGDHSVIADVIKEVLNNYKQIGKIFDVFCCIFPTAPLINLKKLEEGLNLLQHKKYDSVFPVLRFSYPIQRALKMKDGRLTMFYPEYLNSRSQDLEPAYHDAGQFYWMWTHEFIKQNTIFSKNSGTIVLEETEIQDIDNESDWKLAELKYKLNSVKLITNSDDNTQ